MIPRVSEFRRRYGPWALITGASSGIGAAFARALGSRGLDLILVARRAERLEMLAGELRASGVQAIPVPLDLTAADALLRLEAAARGREVGLLVNNAGYGASGAFAAVDREWQTRMVRLNCEVPVAMAHTFLPPMLARRRGGMIVVASTAGYQATPWMAVYGATKAFDLHWAEALRVELHGSGVDVLALCPGHTETEFHEVAGVRASATGLSTRPERVVDVALRRLGRRAAAVPGLANRILVSSTRCFPRALAARAAGWILSRRSPGGS